MCTFAGLDLAGSSARPSGWALMDKKIRLCAEPEEVFTDEAIIKRIEKFPPSALLWIGIDAPLSFPRGEKKMRLCDRKLGKFGSPALSPLLIASVTRRGARLAKLLREKSYRVIEVYPRATQRILGIKAEGKKSSLRWRTSCQKELSTWVEGISPLGDNVYSSHILDAILCAYTAYCRWKGNYQEIGDKRAKVVVPSLTQH